MVGMIRVFPRRTAQTPTDDMVFVGEPPLFRPDADEVHISVAFTWDLDEAERLARSWGRYYSTVRVGGPALGDYGNGFVPGQYVAPGVTFTSRGCPNHCRFCLVPEREGGIRELPICEGWNIQDNNLLACSDRHVEQVFQMLDKQSRAAKFAGGLEARRVTSSVVDRMRSLRIHEVWLAYDTPGAWADAERAVRLLRDGGLRLRQVRCFVLAGMYDDVAWEAEYRCQQVLDTGALPFMMLYQPAEEWVEYSDEWQRACRKWTRPAAMMANETSQQTIPLSI